MKDLTVLVPLLLTLFTGCAKPPDLPAGLSHSALPAGRISMTVPDLYRDPVLAKKNPACLHNRSVSNTYRCNTVPVRFYMPANYRYRVMILLPGWRHPNSVWEKYSVLFQLAEQYGVALVMPQMGRANYLTRWYPETRGQMKWQGGIPSLLWVGRVLLPWIRERFGSVPLYVAGYSTGARGAMMSATRYPVFAGAGYLSGDWDLVTDQGLLYRWSLGLMEKFPCRWRRDNSKYLAYRLKDTRVYASHGLKDRTTPAGQTELMHRDLDRLKIDNVLELDASGGHNWAYWNRQFPRMFRWFFGNAEG